MRKMIILFSCVALSAAIVGCQTAYRMEGLQKVKAKFKPEKRKMLIVPFKDPAYTYFESVEGTELARDLGDYMQRWKVTEVVYDSFFPRGMDALAKTKLAEGDEVEAWKALAKEMNCELVVIGQIEEFVAGGEQSVNVVKGFAMVQVQVLDMKRDAVTVWRLPSTPVNYPEGWEYADLPTGDIAPKTLKTRLLNKAAEAIGQCFHDHLEPIS